MTHAAAIPSHPKSNHVTTTSTRTMLHKHKDHIVTDRLAMGGSWGSIPCDKPIPKPTEKRSSTLSGEAMTATACGPFHLEERHPQQNCLTYLTSACLNIALNTYVFVYVLLIVQIFIRMHVLITHARSCAYTYMHRIYKYKYIVSLCFQTPNHALAHR